VVDSVVVATLPVLAMPLVVVAPVTARVPPTVSLVVTAAEFSVAAPVVDSVVVVTLPVLVMPCVVVAPVTVALPVTVVPPVAVIVTVLAGPVAVTVPPAPVAMFD
jgi:hypothetical protein